MRKYLPIPLLLSLLLLPAALHAQTATETPTPPPATADAPIPQVHTVSEGENPTYIAGLYGIPVEELLAVNNLTPEAVLFIGQTLTIPGGQGEAVATVYTAQLGDTLAAVAAAFNTDVASLMAENGLLNRDFDLAPGQQLVVVSRTGSALPTPVSGTPHVVTAGDTLLIVATRYGLSPAALAAANGLPYPTYLFAGQRLRIPIGEAAYRDLPGEWVDVQIRPYPPTQGDTVSIYVENLLDGVPTGQLAGQPLRFVPSGAGFTALVGLDAFTPAGSHPLQLSGSGSRPWTPLRETITVQDGGYGTQPITVPEELNALLDPNVRQSEDAFLATIYTQFRETQDWEGVFQVPVTSTVVTAPYGDARSYNGGPFDIFHTGVDFGAAAGVPVYAAANGVVAFSGPLQLRGNAVIVDHGRGVMTAYFHLTESLVMAGEPVRAGQLIATVGSTGLSSGPHLHWDLRILDVPVNGLQWTTTPFP
ncbi:MAG: LysM peptidoglycan-binding domain-containing protein [Anaerolineales bacterium]|nr:LysM peptidoglycan-binding domain-containing protein [Anaerolineales bacterium]